MAQVHLTSSRGIIRVLLSMYRRLVIPIITVIYSLKEQILESYQRWLQLLNRTIIEVIDDDFRFCDTTPVPTTAGLPVSQTHITEYGMADHDVLLSSKPILY